MPAPAAKRARAGRPLHKAIVGRDNLASAVTEIPPAAVEPAPRAVQGS